jgi:LTXXQ motif family protein
MHCRSLLAVLVLAAAPLAGQQPGGMGRGHMSDMEGPMMRELGPAMMQMMLYTPQHLLARKDALGLSADQVRRLTALRSALDTARDRAMAAAAAHMKEMDLAVSPAPDTAALKTHFQAAHDAMGKGHWAVIAAAAQGRGVLTDAQRAKVQVWADSMQAWMQEHRQMMRPTNPH